MGIHWQLIKVRAEAHRKCIWISRNERLSVAGHLCAPIQVGYEMTIPLHLMSAKTKSMMIIDIKREYIYPKMHHSFLFACIYLVINK